jgi:SnoaL-like domain
MTTVSELLQANLRRVFNERDAVRRKQAIHELYASDAILYDDKGQFSGTDAIVDALNELLGGLPPKLEFVLNAVAENHDMGKLLWKGRLPDGTIVVTGTDVAQVEGERIRALYVFVDGQP